MTNQLTKVAVSVGDPNGIGSEILLKLLSRKDILEICTPIICASKQYWTFISKYFKFQKQVVFIEDSNKIVEGKINVLCKVKTEVQINFGKSDIQAGLYSFESLEIATDLVKNKNADCLVTVPINKDNIQSDNFDFPGHTEYLENKWNGDALMFMVEENIKVGLVTQHIPLKNVVNTIQPKLLRLKMRNIIASLKEDFNIAKPKVAVLSINPHAGDNGLIGSEESEILIPFIKGQTEKGNLVYGPYPSDSFFSPRSLKQYDAVLAMYHDQGLIPFKTIAGLKGVNFTAGLSFVRTSPDHGVGYDIAGKGIAEEESLVEALYLAVKIYKNRKLNSNLKADALKPQNKRESRNKYN